jgi:glutamate 5-kinase
VSKVIVIKLGTSSITNKDGKINENYFSKVVSGVSVLHKKGFKIIMVSSGAVGNGKPFLKKYKGTLSERKAAAAIGNPILLNKYAKAFSEYGIIIAQSLLERSHFSQRNHFLQLRDTIETLWANDVIPIANENDVVSDLEIKFSDNDHLATLIAAGFGAEKLLIVSSVEGILDGEGNVIRVVEDSKFIEQNFIANTKSDLGLGGMNTKLHYATMAAEMGIATSIIGLKTKSPILKGMDDEIGTRFIAAKSKPKARERWLASGSLTNAAIEIDQGAAEAVKVRKSLLAVGVIGITNDFSKGEIIEIRYKKEKIAVGVSRISSKDLFLKLNKNNTVVVHVNDTVLI